MSINLLEPHQVDFHCHLDLYPDHLKAVEFREREKTYTLAVTTTPRAWPRNKQLESNKLYIKAALGLHPQLVATHASELRIWTNFLPETRYIGEVGLDASKNYYQSLDKQKIVFKEILKSCAKSGDKILSVHSVKSSGIVLDMIETFFPARSGKIVLHWFSGAMNEARRAVEMGCYFSINEKMLQSKNGQKLVQSIPIERILTESDGPFTEKWNVVLPSNLDLAISGLSKLQNKSVVEVKQYINQNLMVLLGPSN